MTMEIKIQLRQVSNILLTWITTLIITQNSKLNPGVSEALGT